MQDGLTVIGSLHMGSSGRSIGWNRCSERNYHAGKGRAECFQASHDPTVLVSVTAVTNCHKLGGLQQTFILHSLQAFRHRGLKSRCWRGHAPSEGLREESFHSSSGFWRLLTILGVPSRSLWLRPSNFCLRLHVAVFSGPLCTVVSFSDSYEDTHLGVRAHLK